MNKEITDIYSVTIGTWYTFCCEDDLAEIKDVGDLVDILKSHIVCLQDKDFVPYRFWHTKEDALSDLLAQPKS